MAVAALVAGVLVLVLTAVRQTGLLGPHDFVTVAGLGVFGAVFCAAVLAGRRTRTALVGLVLSLLPVALLVLYLAISDG